MRGHRLHRRGDHGCAWRRCIFYFSEREWEREKEEEEVEFFRLAASGKSVFRWHAGRRRRRKERRRNGIAGATLCFWVSLYCSKIAATMTEPSTSQLWPQKGRSASGSQQNRMHHSHDDESAAALVSPRRKRERRGSGARSERGRRCRAHVDCARDHRSARVAR